MKKTLILLALALGLLLPAYAPAAGVARAQFTSGIADREPVDELSERISGLRTVYFFTDLRDLDGRTVTHRWEYAGKVMAEVSFDVRGPRWRVWSSKNLLPEWTGEWTVAVVDEDGRVLTEKSFEYVRSEE